MPLIVPNSAEVFILRYVTNSAVPEDLDIRLYVNDLNPDESVVVGNFIEANGGDYAKIELNSTLWIVTPGEPTVAEHPQVSWTFTGAVGSVYGYYITRRTTGDLVWAERFTNGPYNVANANDQIRVTPRLTAN